MNWGHYKTGCPRSRATSLMRAMKFSMCGINSSTLQESRCLSMVTQIDGRRYNRYSADCKPMPSNYMPVFRTCLQLTRDWEVFLLSAYLILLYFTRYLRSSSTMLSREHFPTFHLMLSHHQFRQLLAASLLRSRSQTWI